MSAFVRTLHFVRVVPLHFSRQGDGGRPVHLLTGLPPDPRQVWSAFALAGSGRGAGRLDMTDTKAVPVPKRPVKLTDAELLTAKAKLRERLCSHG